LLRFASAIFFITSVTK